MLYVLMYFCRNEKMLNLERLLREEQERLSAGE